MVLMCVQEADERVLVEKLGEEGMEERVKTHLAAKEEELRMLLDQEYQGEVWKH